MNTSDHRPAHEEHVGALDLSLPKVGPLSNFDGGQDVSVFNVQMNENDSTQLSVNGTSHLNASSQLHADIYQSRMIIMNPTSEDIRNIRLPAKHVSVGRPKGSVNTVIGTKRKEKSGQNKSTIKKIKV